MQPKFKTGDKVTCSESFEVQQPMEIAGVDRWFDSGMMMRGEMQYVYVVKGTHNRKGTPLTIRIEESLLQHV